MIYPVDDQVHGGDDSFCDPTAQTPMDCMFHPLLTLRRESEDQKDIGNDVKKQSNGREDERSDGVGLVNPVEGVPSLLTISHDSCRATTGWLTVRAGISIKVDKGARMAVASGQYLAKVTR